MPTMELSRTSAPVNSSWTPSGSASRSAGTSLPSSALSLSYLQPQNQTWTFGFCEPWDWRTGTPLIPLMTLPLPSLNALTPPLLHLSLVSELPMILQSSPQTTVQLTVLPLTTLFTPLSAHQSLLQPVLPHITVTPTARPQDIKPHAEVMVPMNAKKQISTCQVITAILPLVIQPKTVKVL